jgi:ApaG protein
MSAALTDGILVEVESQFQPKHSEPKSRRWLFSYTVTIRNEGSLPARLRSRHWVITDGTGHVEEVRGDGVVGHQPRLEPGEAFQYTSYCVLGTTHGSMQGEYLMERDDGAAFDAAIAQFPLKVPQLVN